MKNIAVWIVFGLLACGSEASDTADIAEAPEGVYEAKPLDSYDFTTPGEAEGIDWDSIPGKADPNDPRTTRVLNLHGPYQEVFDRHLNRKEVEKGTTSMLMGQGIRGSLHYQDGVCTEPDCGQQPDHCSLFGLTCDNAWHMQARKLDFPTSTSYFTEFSGACAPAASLDDGGAWAPCVFPNLYPGHRAMKYRIDISTCPNDSVQRQAMLDGWASMIAMTSGQYGLGLTWSSTTGSDWNYLITCAHVPGDQTTFAYETVRGSINLKYGIAIAGGENLWVDDCDSPSLPGSGPGGVNGYVAIQSQDMVYVSTKHQIVVDMTNAYATGNVCTNNSLRKMFYYHNLFLHELGHSLGLNHDQLSWAYTQDFPVMIGTDTCGHMTDRKMNLHPFYRTAINSLDVSTTQALDVYDDDLSCFKQSEY